MFDEATSSLDSLTEEDISHTIRDVATSGDAITILIAHRLSTVMHADRIYVLERGHVVEDGKHDDLLAGEGLVLRDVETASRRTTRDDAPGSTRRATAGPRDRVAKRSKDDKPTRPQASSLLTQADRFR